MRRAIGFLMLALTASMAANAGKTTATLNVESTRIFRGGVYNDDGVPFTKGQLTYTLDSGLILTTFAENLLSQYNYKATVAGSTSAGLPNNFLFDFRQMIFSGVGYRLNSDSGWTLTTMLGQYYLPEKRVMDATDLLINFKTGNLEAHLSFMPKFFQWTETNQIYVSVDYEVVLDEGLSFVPHLGYSMYSSTDASKNTGGSANNPGNLDKVLHKNYMDYTLALRHQAGGMRMDVGWAFTNRMLVGTDTELATDDRPFMRASFTF